MSYRTLLVGDPHVEPHSIDDCEKLMAYVAEVALKERAVPVLLGDLYHTHAVIRAEVMWFWRNTFEMFQDRGVTTPWVLVGNHDFAGEGLAIHALAAHEHTANVVDAPLEQYGILYLPYMADREEMVRACQGSSAKTVICHQTFDGASYENGFYASDGVDQNLLPQETIISGHIHTPQTLGKVVYIGAPRWRTLSDANIDRAIWLYTFDDSGRVESKKAFSTNGVCRQIRHVIDTPEAPIEEPLSSDVDWRVDIKGPADWIERRKAELAGEGVKIRALKANDISPKLRESEGIVSSFRGFLSAYRPKHGTAKEELAEMAKERLHV